MTDRIVRIAAGSGGRIDSPLGVLQHLASPVPPDYIVFDHMAEAMMSAFLIEMGRDPGAGWSQPFLDSHLLPWLDRILARGIRVITNAGGLNPHAAAAALKARAAQLGLHPRIGVVSGDDLRPQLAALGLEGHCDMFSGAPWPDQVIAANAYFGAFPIAEALDRGAQIVLTGRVVDSALTLGPLIHEFGWQRGDLDRLASGTLAGHLLECGAQATGGTFTDWLDLPGLDDIGFAVAECRADGSFVVTKPEDTGGAASIGTVAEQALYEVSDPAAYAVPDVICDFSGVTLSQIGPDRVAVRGARGRAPSGCYKVCAISDEGWKAVGLLPVIGTRAADKARRMAGAIFARTARLVAELGLPEPMATHSELFGAGELTPHAPGGNAQAAEALARLVYRTRDARAARLFATECAAICLNGSAGTLFSPLAPAISPSHLLFCFLLPRDRLAPQVTVDGETIVLAPEAATVPPAPEPPRPAVDERPGGGPAQVSLVDLAWVRSGDKGNLFNLAVIAREADYLPHIRAALTAGAMAEWMAHEFDDPARREVIRHDAPGLNALNFVLAETMRGSTGTNLRMDLAAKGMGQQLLDFPVPVPEALARQLRARAPG
ncbi:acyclic terpene utilization AtuA family protein [Novosphingobium bradum]|uniref:Acyclic terpene utilization AtuA family protein n=1 Tax=Novosphingobium bradum TaxID=1737444 RepID=A0ABV7IJT8_9SPHN